MIRTSSIDRAHHKVLADALGISVDRLYQLAAMADDQRAHAAQQLQRSADKAARLCREREHALMNTVEARRAFEYALRQQALRIGLVAWPGRPPKRLRMAVIA